MTGGDSICNDIPVPEPSFGTTEDVINKFKKFNNFSDPEFGKATEDALNRFKKLNNITDEN